MVENWEDRIRMSFCSQCGVEIQEKVNFCPECGSPMDSTDAEEIGKVKRCTRCNALMPADMFYCLNCGKPFDEGYNDFDVIREQVHKQTGTWKNKWVALLLCIFFGGLGIHRFYEGKIATGLLYLFTYGLLGLGWIVDIVRIACKPNPYRVK